jgi:tRNA G10  N-methylase Trm11
MRCTCWSRYVGRRGGSADITWRRAPDYVPPKKPYSFLAMLDDILIFSSETLVDGGRLSFWMPTANDEEQEIAIPTHPCLELVSACVQPFYKCMVPKEQRSPLGKGPILTGCRVQETSHISSSVRRRSIARSITGLQGTAKHRHNG